MNRVQFSVVAFAVALALAGGCVLPGPEHVGPRQRPGGRDSRCSVIRRAQGPLLARPDGPGPALRQAGQVAVHGHAAVPVYADAASDSGVKVSPQVQQNLGIRTATVKRATMSARRSTRVGTVQFDERLNVAVQTRVAGYVERLAVRAPMERVAQGAGLATVFAPEWLGPLNEMLALKRAGVVAETLAAARERTARHVHSRRRWSARARRAARPRRGSRCSRRSGGVVAELGVREGVAVSPGMTLFRIAGLEKVWAVAEVPEAQAVRLTRGQKVKAVLQADASQTLRRRAEGDPAAGQREHAHAAGALRGRQQGRQADARACCCACRSPARRRPAWSCRPRRSSAPAPARWPSSARTTAASSRAKCKLGADLGDDLEVVQGLDEGDQVVASGQFLDRLRGAPALGAGQHGSRGRLRRGRIGRAAPARLHARRARSKASRPTASPSRTARCRS